VRAITDGVQRLRHSTPACVCWCGLEPFDRFVQQGAADVCQWFDIAYPQHVLTHLHQVTRPHEDPSNFSIVHPGGVDWLGLAGRRAVLDHHQERAIVHSIANVHMHLEDAPRERLRHGNQ
jgi:hypothetical protein